ncbi:hypothetical protein SAMN04489812_0161 [Microlunatus soli]|uniref:Uncharacterized protein n=1 Tax=Microlunatus soli TaxID=630515 RepID=A0A1H1MJK3_9ACTN|nr:hypothetical protein SAMN04489812_0161 [Microlunatus soli]
MSSDPTVALLAPLVGRWSGTARIAWPGRDPFELTHAESIQLVGDRTMITIEGNSCRDGIETPGGLAMRLPLTS